MTINTTDITSGPYIGNDSTSQFSYDFRVEDKSQLTVFETTDLGVESILVVDVDYTVNGIGTDGGGTIDRIAGALPQDYTWYIRSNYQLDQLIAFASQGGFFPDVHERAVDKLTFLIQQHQDLINRSVRLPKSYSGDAVLTLPAPEADKTILWSSDGLSMVNGPSLYTFQGWANAAALSESNAADSEAAAALSAIAAAAATSAGLYKDVVTLTFADNPYTVSSSADGDLFKVDTSGGNVVVNLPDISLESNDLRFAFVKDSGDANTLTVQRQGSDTINGNTSTAIVNQYRALNIIGDQSTSSWVALDATTDSSLIATNNLSDVGSVSVSQQNLDLEPGVNIQVYDAATMKTDVAQTMAEQLTVKETADTEYNLTGTIIDPANGGIQYKTLGSNTTFTESLENGQGVLLMIDDGSAYTITWPTMTWLNNGGSAPDLSITGYTAINIFQMGGIVYGLLLGDGS